MRLRTQKYNAATGGQTTSSYGDLLLATHGRRGKVAIFPGIPPGASAAERVSSVTPLGVNRALCNDRRTKLGETRPAPDRPNQFVQSL